MNTKGGRERRVGNSGEKVNEAEGLEILAGSVFLGQAGSIRATALSGHAETFFRLQKHTGWIKLFLYILYCS